MTNLPDKETRTRLWEALKKIEVAQAFKITKWERKMDEIWKVVTEHISKLLLWNNDTQNRAQWCNSIAKSLKNILKANVIIDDGIRSLTAEEIKADVFDAEMYNAEEFESTLKSWIVDLKPKGLVLEEEPDFYELWQRYCKVRDELLVILTNHKESKETLQKQIQETCEHFTIWNYANTY